MLVVLSLLASGCARVEQRPAPPFVPATATCSAALVCDGFEDDTTGQLPGAPWREETYGSGAVIAVSEQRAFSGRRSLQVTAPAAAPRRAYVALHGPPLFPAAGQELFGRAMVWLDTAPRAADSEMSVHWSLLQGEGRAADNRHNAIYRLGGEFDSGLRLKANYETTPPVRSDCRQHSRHALPVAQWTCVEWHFDAHANELQFWLNGAELTDIHIRGHARGADGYCAHTEDLQGEWQAPPAFQSMYLGFERYESTVNDQNLWIDDVVLSTSRIGCPTGFP
jgi:hypothetical protein